MLTDVEDATDAKKLPNTTSKETVSMELLSKGVQIWEVNITRLKLQNERR